MANLTVTIDDALLKRARLRALEQGTSVNALIRDQLEAFAGVGHEQRARRKLVEISHSTTSGSGPGGRSWSRDELHER